MSDCLFVYLFINLCIYLFEKGVSDTQSEVGKHFDLDSEDGASRQSSKQVGCLLTVLVIVVVVVMVLLVVVAVVVVVVVVE